MNSISAFLSDCMIGVPGPPSSVILHGAISGVCILAGIVLTVVQVIRKRVPTAGGLILALSLLALSDFQAALASFGCEDVTRMNSFLALAATVVLFPSGILAPFFKDDVSMEA